MKLSVRHQLYKSDFIEMINFKFNEITEKVYNTSNRNNMSGNMYIT